MIEHWARPGAIADGPAVRPEFPVPAALGVAGFFFPMVMLWIVSGLGMVVMLATGQTTELLRGVVWFVVAQLMLFPIGMIFFMFVLVAAVPVWGLWLAIRRTLGARLDDATLATHAGATLGFLLPLGYVEFMSGGMTSAGEGLALFLMTCVATPLGQYAGAWSQWPLHDHKAPSDKWQFGIRQLMVATGWIAGALGAMKLLGLLTPVHLAVLGAWLVTQWGTGKGVFRFCRWRVKRRREGDGGGMRG